MLHRSRNSVGERLVRKHLIRGQFSHPSLYKHFQLNQVYVVLDHTTLVEVLGCFLLNFFKELAWMDG